ncbi:MAG: hypothetical protein EP329_14475 [Deltaproteobacteria bacterium]|nr:MAG: hypothetical protein EP329_14475 [Deltaproteobacteria bacterium]
MTEPTLAPDPPTLEAPRAPADEVAGAPGFTADQGARLAGLEAEGAVTDDAVSTPPPADGATAEVAPEAKLVVAEERVAPPAFGTAKSKGRTHHGGTRATKAPHADRREQAPDGGTVAEGGRAGAHHPITTGEATAFGDRTPLSGPGGADTADSEPGSLSVAADTAFRSVNRSARVPLADEKKDEESLDEDRPMTREARWRELRRRVAEGNLAEAERILRIIVAEEGESAESRAVADVLARAKASRLPEKATATPETGLQ